MTALCSFTACFMLLIGALFSVLPDHASQMAGLVAIIGGLLFAGFAVLFERVR